eukprot:2524684-Prymnesium_polylepis.1
MKWVADMGLEPVRPREVEDGLSTLSPSRGLAGMGVSAGSGGDAEKRREVWWRRRCVFEGCRRSSKGR